MLDTLDSSVSESDYVDSDTTRCLAFLGMAGDIQISWDPKNDEKVKAIIKKKMAQGYSFFSMRKVVVEAIKIKRKVGKKGVDTIDNLVIDDETFEKMITSMDDADLAEALHLGTVRTAKRRGSAKQLSMVERLKTPEDVINKRQAIAVKPIVGG